MYFKRTNDSVALNILNIWLDPESTLTAVFELCRGNDLIGTLRMPARQLGYGSFDTVPKIGTWQDQTPSLGIWLSGQLPPDGSPLWLSFGTHPDPSGSVSVSPRIGATQSRPSGFLAVLSWELNLTPVLGRPVLRMQGLPVRPLTQHQTLHLVLCCSFAAAKQSGPPEAVLERIFRQIPSLDGQTLTLHVFGDLQLTPLLQNLSRLVAPSAQVVIYDPADARVYGDARRSRDVAEEVSDLQNPWLLWMRDKLANVGVDAVQFISHGYTTRGHGALAFAESPLHNTDPHWARFVGTRELSLFLDQLGAWSIILTSPDLNFSAAGLRILQDELTDYVAGPVVSYEMADDPAGVEFRTVFDYLFNLSDQSPPMGQSISFYSHPDWKKPRGGQEDMPTDHLLDEFTLAGRLHDRFAGADEVPAWLAAGQRSLERSVAKISLAGAANGAAGPARRGKEDALRFTADLFTKFASLGKTDL